MNFVRQLILAAAWYFSAMHGFESYADDHLQELIDKINFERQQIQTAVFTVKVDTVVSVTSKADGTQRSRRDEHWTGVCTFDALTHNSLMRYELTGDISNTIKPAPKRQRFVSHLGPDGFSVYDSTTARPALHFFKDQRTAAHQHVRLAPMNPQCVGLSFLSNLKHGDSLAVTLSGLLLDKDKLVVPAEVDHSEELGTTVLSQIHKNGSLRSQIVFDRKRDWVPISRKTEYGQFDAAKNNFSVTRMSFESKIEWQEFEGSLVSRRFTETHILPGYSVRSEADPKSIDITTTTSTATFEWELVNKAIDPSCFQYRNYKLPVGTYVIDVRVNPPIVLGRIGDANLSGLIEPLSP